MITETKNRPEYFIVEDDHHEYLVKRGDGKQAYLIRARTREQIYYAILTDLYAPVFEATPGQLLEAMLGEPQSLLGSKVERFKEESRAKRLFPEPVQLEIQIEAPYKSRGSGVTSDFCRIHDIQKHKDGFAKGGVQKYRCPKCIKRGKGSQPSISYSRAARTARKVTKNPKCSTCGERLRVKGRHRNAQGSITTYWKCTVNRCPQIQIPVDPGKVLLAEVTARVRKANGFDPQLREDIIGEILKDISGGKIKLEQVDKELIKGYATFESRLQSNKYHDVSIDQPKGGNEGGLTLKDTLEG